MQFFPRAYYLLGWNNEQFAVYYGAEYDAATQSINCVGGGTANITSSGLRTVLMWNAEYNTYGNGSNINLTYKYNSDGTWKKYYNINDHLGNVRTVLRKEINPPATILKQFDYAPFGKVLCSSSNCENRTKFIGKEKDKESNYADHGVRKYDDEIGRFTSIDPLWEKYYSWTPYHYCRDNPISAYDKNGFFDVLVSLPSDRNNTGTLTLTSRNGTMLFQCKALGKGKAGDNRMKTNANTPLGIYDIPNKLGGIFLNDKKSIFGPSPRMVLVGESGEIKESGRTEIRVHGKPNEKKDEEGNVILQETHGCIRISNEDAQMIYETVKELFKTDPEEYGGKLEVIETPNENESTEAPKGQLPNQR